MSLHRASALLLVATFGFDLASAIHTGRPIFAILAAGCLVAAGLLTSAATQNRRSPE